MKQITKGKLEAMKIKKKHRCKEKHRRILKVSTASGPYRGGYARLSDNPSNVRIGTTR